MYLHSADDSSLTDRAGFKLVLFIIKKPDLTPF